MLKCFEQRVLLKAATDLLKTVNCKLKTENFICSRLRLPCVRFTYYGMKVELHPLQVAAWKAMPPEQKWDLVRRSNRMLREAIEGRLKKKHPDWSKEQVEEATSREILRARP